MTQLNVRIPESDHTALKIKSATERKSVSDILVEALNEVLAGTLDPAVDKPPVNVTTTASVDEDLKLRLDTYAEKHGIPLNKLVRLTLRAKLAQGDQK